MRWPRSSRSTPVTIMLGFQSAPGALIAANDTTVLALAGLPVTHARTVLADAGLLTDDRLPAVILWARRRLRDLPAAIRTEMDTWVHITLNGQDTPPRRRPRTAITARAYVAWALPALTHWVAAGRQSLREITPDDVRAALPENPTARSLMGRALRSIFSLLKAQKLTFTDPTRGISTGGVPGKIPLPVPTDDIRQALTSPQPARALLTALIAFHGLTSRHLQHLHLTHLDHAHLTVNDRSIPLAAPVMQRMTAYLEYRSQRWPATTNPHLFIHLRTAASDQPVGPLWINRTLGPALTPRRLREDRYLDEARATAGDAKALALLFGLGTKAAQRYTRTFHPPSL
ncbi:hypothetical protein AQJ30_13835 [Streptomyces longwoodensis]|uniref:Integrase n=1 Tax=Streptomyces longwoodensis TaxID=68231 RepID=A0A101QYT6_9ACTN|nr:hypothetical protein AQJ30_13835 [Streptomyces longwoodensis]